MYFTPIQFNSNESFFCDIKNHILEEHDAVQCSLIVANHGVALFQKSLEFGDLKDWCMEMGYHIDNRLPYRDYYNFDTFLSLYPDNEEMLVIYNKIDQPIKLSISNTRKLQDDIAHWNRWNLYDDVWGTVINENFDVNMAKDIRQSKNFDTQNFSKYSQPRKNSVHKLKIFPRHPIKTKCMFAPKLHMKELTLMTKDRLENHGQEIEGFTSHPIDPRYCREYMLQPQTFIILDQIITQWKMVSHQSTDLEFIPLWYKTEVRKHFNYSI